MTVETTKQYAHGGLILWCHGSGSEHVIHCLARCLADSGGRVQVVDSAEFATGESSGREGNVMAAKAALMLCRQGVLSLVQATGPDSGLPAILREDANTLELTLGDLPTLSPNHRQSLPLPDGEPSLQAQAALKAMESLGLLDPMEQMLDGLYRSNILERLATSLPASLMLVARGMASKPRSQILRAMIEHVADRYKLGQPVVGPPILFVAGLPKSGSTWIKKMLAEVPGYHAPQTYDPARTTVFHDVSPLFFELLPRNVHHVIKLHTRYTPANLEVLRRAVGRFTVIYRDPRDVVISRYHHVLKEAGHRHHSLYLSVSRDEAIAHCLTVVATEYVPWIQGWRRAMQENPGLICEVRYEDLRKDVGTAMANVLEFYGLRPNPALLARMAATGIRKPSDLNASFRVGETKRKGLIGEWREYFNEDHKALFLAIAGEAMASLGYGTGPA